MEATKELSTLIIYVTVVIVLMVGFLVYFCSIPKEKNILTSETGRRKKAV